MGTIYRWKIDADGIPAANFGGGVSEATAPYGLEGGKPAPPHQLFLHKGKETTKVDAESFYHLDKGDVFEIYQSGGGGYGNPHKRPAEKVREDVVNGLISVAKARELYGVVMEPGNQTLDTAGTMAARRS
jgi:N-methylhydantoinase B